MKSAHRRGKAFSPLNASQPEAKRNTSSDSESASEGSISSLRISSVSPTNAMRIGTPISDSVSDGSATPTNDSILSLMNAMRIGSPVSDSASEGSEFSHSQNDARAD